MVYCDYVLRCPPAGFLAEARQYLLRCNIVRLIMNTTMVSYMTCQVTHTHATKRAYVLAKTHPRA